MAQSEFMSCFPFASFRNVTPACVSKWVSVCKPHRAKLTGIRAQPESSSSIRSMMCSALKALFKHCWVQFVKWRLLVWAASSVVWEPSSDLSWSRPCELQVVCVWSLLSRPEGRQEGMAYGGCAPVPECFCLFWRRHIVFGTATADISEAARDQSQSVPPSSQGLWECLNELLSSLLVTNILI